MKSSKGSNSRLLILVSFERVPRGATPDYLLRLHTENSCNFALDLKSFRKYTILNFWICYYMFFQISTGNI